MKKLFKIAKEIKSILKDNLVGVYLHGSVATEGYYPWTTDIDLLIIIKNKLSKKEKDNVIKYLKKTSKKSPIIESTIVLEKEINSSKNSKNFELYFHPDEISRGGSTQEISMYLYEAKKIGKCLYGESARKIFSKVPEKYFILSIIKDVKSPSNNPVKKLERPSYGCLNLCRTLAFLKKDKLFSKINGGKWAIKNLPEKYSSLVKKILIIHKSKKDINLNKKELKEFRNYMLKRIIREGNKRLK